MQSFLNKFVIDVIPTITIGTVIGFGMRMTKMNYVPDLMMDKMGKENCSICLYGLSNELHKCFQCKKEFHKKYITNVHICPLCMFKKLINEYEEDDYQCNFSRIDNTRQLLIDLHVIRSLNNDDSILSQVPNNRRLIDDIIQILIEEYV